MSKEGGNNMFKVQTCVLKVNIHCDGCEKKVKKLLHKTEGVYTTTIDADQGKVTVSGTIDPATIIKKLNKAGKHAELWPTKGSNNPHVLQQQHAKGQQKQKQDDLKPQKDGASGGKDQQQKLQQLQLMQQQQQQKQHLQQLQQLQQIKGFKDLKLPNLKFPFKKEQKTVRFDLPPEDSFDDGSDYDDDFDDDEDFDDMDGFDDFYDDPKMRKTVVSAPPAAAKDKKDGGGGGGNAKKGGGDHTQNQSRGGGKNGGEAAHGIKNGSGGKNDKGGNGGNNGGGKKGGGGGKNDVVGGGGGKLKPSAVMPHAPNMMMGRGFPGMDLGQMGGGANMPPAGAMPHMAGSMPAFQGPVTPEMMAAANPYQQQYMQAMLQQQQRMMMMNGNGNGGGGAQFTPMGYGYGYGSRPTPGPAPAPAPAYIPPLYPHGGGEPFTMFSDENPNSCSVM